MRAWGRLLGARLPADLQAVRAAVTARAVRRSRSGLAARAPVESSMPLRLARYGVLLAETAPVGLAAAGIEQPPIQFTAE